MKRLLIVAGFLVLVSIGINANDIAGLEDQLPAMNEDTIKVNALLKLGSYYCYSDADKALVFLQEALMISASLTYKKGMGSTFLWMGRTYYYKDEYELAIRHLEKAKDIFIETNNQEEMIRYHQFTGTVNSLIGNFPNAIRNYQKAIDLSKEHGIKKDIYLSYCGLGSVFLQRPDPYAAKEYFTEALSWVHHIDDPALKSILFTNLGKVYELTHDLDSALLFYEQSLEIRKIHGSVRMIASSQYNIGNVLIKKGQYQQGVQYIETSLEKFSEISDDTGICINLIAMVEGLFYQGEKDQAIKVAMDAIALAGKLNNASLKSEAYMTIAPLMAQAGNHAVAYEYMRINNLIQDSLAQINREKVISELEVQFQTARKNDEIKLLKSLNEIQHKNILLLYISLSGLVIILILLFVLFRYKSKSLKRQQELYQSEKTIGKQQEEIREKEQLLLKEQLETKNRELASKALEMYRINETISGVIEKLESVSEKDCANEKIGYQINQIVSGLEAKLKNNSWNEFEMVFNNIHSDFFRKLLSACPDLTSSEIKTAALLKLNLSTKEIAAITFKSEAGIKSARYRLRKKLALDNDESLMPFLMKLS